MPLVLDSTPKSPTGNSFASVAQADAYHEGTGNNSGWTTLSTPQKESLLVWATTILNSSFEFKGSRTTYEQKLKWPRYGVCIDEKFLDAEAYPDELVSATCELARLLNTKDFTADVSTDAAKRIKIGTIEVEMKRDGEQAAKVIPDYVRLLISPLILGSKNSSQFRFYR